MPAASAIGQLRILGSSEQQLIRHRTHSHPTYKVGKRLIHHRHSKI